MSDLVRVSDVLRLLFPYSLDYVDQERLDEGTRSHFEMEVWVNNKIHGYQGTIDYRILPVIQWLSKQKVEFVGAEERQNHKYGYSGQPDVDVIWNDEPWIWDWKFSEFISEQNRMQLTAYHHFEGRKVAFIQCKRDGTVRAIKCKPDPQLWSAFLSGLNVLRFRNSRIPLQLTPDQIDRMKTEVNKLCRTN